MVQTPVHTSAEKYAHLQGGSNPVCAFLLDDTQDTQGSTESRLSLV
jgi:hypothetical protein